MSIASEHIAPGEKRGQSYERLPPALDRMDPRGWPTANLNVTREQLADKLFSESCQELARIRDMLAPAFARHQKALDEVAKSGRECRFPGMGKLLTEAWREFQVQEQVAKERRA